MADNFKDAFSNFTNKIENNEVQPKEEATVVKDSQIVEEDDAFAGAVISGIDLDDTPVTKPAPTSANTNHNIKTAPASNETTAQERWKAALRERMADMANKDPSEFKTQSDKMVLQLLQYRKDLMINNGFTAEEADRAADNRLKTKATEANTEFLKNNPDLAVITIDKFQSDKLEFTDEEKQKLVRTKAIKLVEVEDAELKTIKIKSAPTDDILTQAIHRVSCNISKFSMPMLNTYDHCEFSGATTTQLVQAVYEENNSLYRRTQEQLELVYTKFMGSTLVDKYGPDNQIIFNKNDFSKWFKFYDLPMAMYTIYVASSTEEITSRFACPKDDGGCGEEYDFTYNCKNLISYDGITESFQDDLANILNNSTDRAELTKARDENRMTKRFKSQYTGNIYDVSSPSVARALEVLRYVRPTDSYATYIAFYAMMFENIYVYDDNDGEYYKIPASEPVNVLKFMYDINDVELKLIAKVVQDLYYVPKFMIRTKCQHCGKVRDSEFSVDELVFLKAQNIEAEIV